MKLCENSNQVNRSAAPGRYLGHSLGVQADLTISRPHIQLIAVGERGRSGLREHVNYLKCSDTPGRDLVLLLLREWWQARSPRRGEGRGITKVGTQRDSLLEEACTASYCKLLVLQSAAHSAIKICMKRARMQAAIGACAVLPLRGSMRHSLVVAKAA